MTYHDVLMYGTFLMFNVLHIELNNQSSVLIHKKLGKSGSKEDIPGLQGGSHAASVCSCQPATSSVSSCSRATLSRFLRGLLEIPLVNFFVPAGSGTLNINITVIFTVDKLRRNDKRISFDSKAEILKPDPA